MEIKHPRRILCLGPPGCDIARVLKGLTGFAPPPDTSGSLAGAAHEWSVKTAYYSADVPIWIDEIADIDEWKAEFMKPEAKEVVEAVGAWVYCFSSSANTEQSLDETVTSSMKAIEAIIERACGYSWDGTRLALDLSQQPGQFEALEEQCLEHSFEYVCLNAKGKNEFGEPQGLERMKEALETNDWAAVTDEAAEDPDAIGDFDAEKAQMNTELWGLKASLLDPDTDEEDEQNEDFQVENMDRMMSQLLAIREASAGMSEEQRKAFASRAINDLVKDL